MPLNKETKLDQLLFNFQFYFWCIYRLFTQALGRGKIVIKCKLLFFWFPWVSVFYSNWWYSCKICSFTIFFLYFLIILFLASKLMVFHWSFRDSKSPQVSRTLFSIPTFGDSFKSTNYNLFTVTFMFLLVITPVFHSNVLLFQNPPVPLSIFWWLYWPHPLQLVSTSFSCSIVFFSSLARSKYLSFFSLFFSFTLWSTGTAKSIIFQLLLFIYLFILFFFFFFFWLSLGVVVWLRLDDLFVYESFWEFCASHSPGRILCCAYTMVKFKFLKQFPVDHLTHLVVSSLILFLC